MFFVISMDACFLIEIVFEISLCWSSVVLFAPLCVVCPTRNQRWPKIIGQGLSSGRSMIPYVISVIKPQTLVETFWGIPKGCMHEWLAILNVNSIVYGLSKPNCCLIFLANTFMLDSPSIMTL